MQGDTIYREIKTSAPYTQDTSQLPERLVLEHILHSRHDAWPWQPSKQTNNVLGHYHHKKHSPQNEKNIYIKITVYPGKDLEMWRPDV